MVKTLKTPSYLWISFSQMLTYLFCVELSKITEKKYKKIRNWKNKQK